MYPYIYICILLTWTYIFDNKINSSDNQKKTKNMTFSEYHSLELSQKLKADNIGSNGCIKCDATPIIAKIYIYTLNPF